ncbi:MAG: ATP-binding protein [Oscillospiraceae bacterium]|nr:ATP-binding protein [Oscillospiraceae bacterium]MBR7010848.1 ATP-binding protein [Oscillospiraceae bacterium]
MPEFSLHDLHAQKPLPAIPAPAAASEDEGWQTLTVLALPGNLERVQEFVGDAAGDGCSMKLRMQLDLAVEEIFINICSYAYAPDVGDAEIRVRSLEEPAAVVVVFSDGGVPYNPLEKEDPDVTVLASERQVGGLGIFLTKQVMDELRYEYRDGKNLLTLVKRL